MEPTVRRATQADVGAVLDVLSAALADDPFVRWLTRGRPGPTNAYLSLMLRRIAMPKGRVDVVEVDGRVASAALWAPPHTFALSASESLRLLPTMARVIGAFRFTRVAASLDDVERARPPEPRWLLTLLGTHPVERGRGFASAVLAPVLARCDADRCVAACETSAPGNLAFYARHGFEVIAERTLAPDGPESWTLRREPQ